MKPYYDRLSATKMQFYELLGKAKPFDSTVIQSGKAIGNVQTDLDMLIFNNLTEIEGICRPEQKAVYDSAVLRIISAKWLQRSNRK